MKPSETIASVVEELDALFVDQDEGVYINVYKRDEWSRKLEEVQERVKQLEAEILERIHTSIFGDNLPSFAETTLQDKVDTMKTEVENLLKTLKE